MEREKRKICHFDSLYGKCVQCTLGAYCSINNNATGRFIMGHHKENMALKTVKDQSICKVSLKQISSRRVIGKASVGRSLMWIDTAGSDLQKQITRCDAITCSSLGVEAMEVATGASPLRSTTLQLRELSSRGSLKPSWVSLLCASKLWSLHTWSPP